MRNPERIIPFIEKVFPNSIKTIIEDIWELEEDNLLVESIILNRDKIQNFWLENPDLRFSQALVCLGMPNYPGFWYYVEEHDILEKLGFL